MEVSDIAASSAVPSKPAHDSGNMQPVDQSADLVRNHDYANDADEQQVQRRAEILWIHGASCAPDFDAMRKEAFAIYAKPENCGQ
jgi:hypothetical protein